MLKPALPCTSQRIIRIYSKPCEIITVEMRNKIGISFLAGAYVLLIPAMFILPHYSVPEYSIISHTLNLLGAQFAPNAWIMNTIFVLLGAGSFIAGWKSYDGFAFHRIILLIFCISLISTSFFNHAPINPDIQYNIIEKEWHSYFTISTFLSFIILAFATSFTLENNKDRILASVAAISTIVLSILMSESDQYAGIWQRLIFLISIGWMIYNFYNSEMQF